MTLFPDPRASPDRPAPEQTAATGPWGGPTYSYRGARIECMAGGHVCALFLEGHPFSGQTFGTMGTITPLVDQWVEGKRLPDYMKVVPKEASQGG
jgi:hypothetical protein